MPSSKPKIQAYVSDRLYQAVQEWKATNGITGDSEAIERLLSAALNLPSDRDIPGEILQEVYQRLNALDERLSTLEKCQGTPLISPVAFEARRILDRVETRIAEFRQPPSDDSRGISGNEFAKLCQCGKRKLREIRDRPEELRQFTFDRTGQPFEYRDGRYFPV